MLFFKSSVLLLASTAVAVPASAPVTSVNAIEKRDLASISNVLNAITESLKGLTASVNSFNGNADQVAPILEGSVKVLNIIKQGTATISQTEAMGLIDSIFILPPVYSLYNEVNNIANALVTKKSAWDKISVLQVVQDQVKEQKAASEELVAAISTKLPSYISFIGTGIGSMVTSLLDGALQQLGG